MQCRERSGAIVSACTHERIRFERAGESCTRKNCLTTYPEIAATTSSDQNVSSKSTSCADVHVWRGATLPKPIVEKTWMEIHCRGSEEERTESWTWAFGRARLGRAGTRRCQRDTR